MPSCRKNQDQIDWRAHFLYNLSVASAFGTIVDFNGLIIIINFKNKRRLRNNLHDLQRSNRGYLYGGSLFILKLDYALMSRFIADFYPHYMLRRQAGFTQLDGILQPHYI